MLSYRRELHSAAARANSHVLELLFYTPFANCPLDDVSRPAAGDSWSAIVAHAPRLPERISRRVHRGPRASVRACAEARA